ncbi:hypothetical protein [Saccharothrix sp. NRRL B-16314]|uniref:hypothetical protein n=1 Tax=Saccharothrix sp. NRRL B-16314 TaxID=1463825 RepID=UPI000527D9D1|nr:hypothetical protein [Saccharothrix sp. NRRL B-16314]
MRALVLAALLLLGAPPASATVAPAAMDYWQYVATYATEQECEEAGRNKPWDVDEHVCWKAGGWDLYWIFPT